MFSNFILVVPLAIMLKSVVIKYKKNVFVNVNVV